MNAIVVHIEKLMPMRVARFEAFGRNPESEAWRKLCQWARPRGLLKDPEANPVFGFNQPAPSSPGAEYGYEFWIRLGPETAVQPPFETLDFPGGWYAVTTLRGLPNPAVWMQLLEWVRKGPHRCRRTRTNWSGHTIRWLPKRKWFLTFACRSRNRPRRGTSKPSEERNEMPEFDAMHSIRFEHLRVRLPEHATEAAIRFRKRISG